MRPGGRSWSGCHLRCPTSSTPEGNLTREKWLVLPSSNILGVMVSYGDVEPFQGGYYAEVPRTRGAVCRSRFSDL